MIQPWDVTRWKRIQRGTLEERWEWIESAENERANIQIAVPDNEMGWRGELAPWLADEATLWTEIRNNLPEVLDILEAHFIAAHFQAKS